MNETIQNAIASDGTFPALIVVLMIVFIPLARARIFPAMPTALLFIAPCAAALIVAFQPQIAIVALALDVVILVVLVVDLLLLPRAADFTAHRSTSRVASLRKPQSVELTVANVSKRTLKLSIRDDVPQEFERDPEEFTLHLDGHTQAVLTYRFQSTKRGTFDLNKVYIRVRSRFLLWQRFLEIPTETVIHVYPDLRQLGEYAMLARTNRLSLLGVRRTRRIGQDNEFERLRDYSHDDNYRHIDWRATARRRKLTVKDFQANQSQRVIFMVDCGRMMTNESEGINLLDHSLNAMLMLSYVALQRGDSVGMLCFSDQVRSFVPARAGMHQMNQLLHASHNQFPDLVESRYDDAFLHLSKFCKKRSLVVLISNLIDEVNANQLHEYLSVLVGRHLPLGVLLRDHRLYEAADNPHARGTEHSLFRAAAAAEILTWRQQVIVDLQHQGVLALDVFPENMTAKLINQYLENKARHLL